MLDIKPDDQKLTFYYNGHKELQRSTTIREVVEKFNRFGCEKIEKTSKNTQQLLSVENICENFVYISLLKAYTG